MHAGHALKTPEVIRITGVAGKLRGSRVVGF